MSRFHSSFSWVAFFATASLSSQALALPRPGEALLSSPMTTSVVAETEYDFNGIARLNNCSGSLVRYENSKKTDKAMILTNGHCVPNGSGFIKPDAYLANTPVARSFFFLASDGTVGTKAVKSTKIIYATMTGTDMALYELALSFEEIENRFDVDALTIASEHPVLNEQIEILSGYWQTGYSCHIDQFIFKLKEDDYTWTDSVRYSETGCQTIHGTSGSPVLSKATRKVIAINNTGNDKGERCTMDNPCEVSESGDITFKKGISYAQQTYIIYSCLNSALAIDLAIPGCKLFH